MNLEDQLRNALQRQDPPEGFAERVIGRAARQRTPRWVWPALAAIAAAVMLSIAGEYRRAQEERAGQQAIMAIRMVADELNMAQNEVLNK